MLPPIWYTEKLTKQKIKYIFEACASNLEYDELSKP